jgi:hypothetical protein
VIKCAWCNSDKLVEPGVIPMTGLAHFKTCPECGGKNVFVQVPKSSDETGVASQQIPTATAPMYYRG